MKINFKEDLFNGVAMFQPFIPSGICFMADEDGGDDGGSGGDDDGGDDDGGDDSDDGGKPDAGLMANASGGDGDDEANEGDKDSGQTIEFKTDKATETLNVPEKFWDKDGDKLNEGAVLKAALDAGKTVRQLQNDLVEAKKLTGKPEDKSGVPEDVKGYLADSEGDNPFIKDGHLQLGEDAKNLKPVPIDDPVVQLFAEQAQKHGLTKDVFTSIVSEVLAGVDDAVPVIDLEAEAEKFGNNAGAVASTNKTWADNMKEAGELSGAEHIQLLNMGQTAVGLSLVNKLRISSGGKSIPVNESGVGGELPSKEEWYASKPDHRTDPVGYKKWQEDGAAIHGTDPAGSSESGLGAPQSQGGNKSSYEGQTDRGRNSRNRK